MAAKTPNRNWGPKDMNEKNNWAIYKQGMDVNSWLYKKVFGCKACSKGRPGKKEKKPAKVLILPSEPTSKTETNEPNTEEGQPGPSKPAET